MESKTAGGVPVVRELKDLLLLERREIEALHRSGVLGGQVSSALKDLYDRVILRAYEDAVERAVPAERSHLVRDLALVAVGGYGRGDLSPFSDVDLLFVHGRNPHAVVTQTVSALVRDLWDVGLKLGHSVRTPGHAVRFAREDLSFRTSLMECRAIAGNPSLSDELQGKTRRLFSRMAVNRFIGQVLSERSREHQDYFAPTVNLLEPNVKKSPGGLRDLHLLRWVAMARYAVRDPEMLRLGGMLTPEDARTLAASAEFLYRIRHELHYHGGTAQDVLTRDEQVRMSEWLGFKARGGQLPVELFMQQVYRHTTALRDVVERFTDGARIRPIWRRVVDRLLTSRVEEHFLLDRERIAIDPGAAEGVLSQGHVLVRCVDLARQHGVRIAHETMERMRRAAPQCVLTPKAWEAFLKFIEDPNGLGPALRTLHALGLLGRFIPAFEHARCLMQWNQYHKYTVDEHSIRAVEAALWRLGDPGPIGQAYRETRRKAVLHLAVLLHDIGKGYEEDHSEVGRKIAEETAARLGLDEKEGAQLVFLVHQHLVMAHTAFRRDVSDLKTIVQFVRKVGTLETLRMLLILTAADTEAVAPGSLTGWKESLLVQLYAAAAEELTGEAPVADEAARAAAIRSDLRNRLAAEFSAEWLGPQLEAMPFAYLQSTPPAVVAAHLRGQRLSQGQGVHVESGHLAEEGLTEYTVFTRDDLTPGIFSKIAGVLAAERFGVVGAQIVTRSDGLVVDTFRGVDVDYKGEPPLHRRNEVAGRIQDVLKGRRSVEDLFALRAAPAGKAGASAGPTQVEIDNSSSDRFTVVEVFADDRPGLLYAVARAIFELGLSVSSARISTRLDQVVDVFFVTEQRGSKIVDAVRLETIRRRLLEVIAAL